MSSASTGGTEGSSPASSPASAASQAMAAPKYGTLVPNRIFVGGISASTSEAELAQLFSTYGNVKATKIILDRAGVSKGYGFVTFETEEEAKRLQQESECIVLRERKLNIAPAIKKQPFNRSFDGGAGSPPAVTTSPYYYTNGMSLPYQNGLTFYNAGAPTPGNPLAPPTDPAALYQAAGVFGPQAASAHQTFAPMMYPCPAPSLYMPQQYQYSPMPYETYYAGAAASQPQYLYSAGNGTSNGNTSSAAATTTSGTGATSPLSNPAHHYYQTSGLQTATPVNHHHHHSHHGNVPNGGGASQSSAPQLDQLYYNFAIGPAAAHHQHSQIPQHQPPSLLGDHQQQQQLLVYTNDCQQTDGQIKSQEETCSTSSNSQSGSHHHHHHHQTTQSTINETHNTSTQSTTATTTTIPALMPLMPLKYPHPYTNYPHPLSLPSPQQQQQQQQQQYCLNDSDESMHCRTILYHPVYIQNSNNSANTSLLPTPPSPFDAQRNQQYHQTTPQKYLSYTNSRSQNGYAIFNPSTIQHSPQFNKYQTPKNDRKSYTNNNNNNRKNPLNSSSSYLLTPSPKSGNLLSQKSNFEYGNVRRNLNYDFSTNRKNYNSNFKLHTTTKDGRINNYDERIVSNKLTSPPPSPYSPLIRPIPNYSPTNIQVQYSQTRYQNHGIGNTTNYQQQSRRYGTTVTGQIMNMGRKQNDKYGNNGTTTSNNQGLVIRANNNKQKVNGMMQINSKNIDDDEQRSGSNGDGDSQQSVLTRMPLTPPGTPRNLQDNQISDSCHQLQALTL